MFNKKRKYESISIEIPEVIREKITKDINDDNFYQERVIESVNKHSLENYITDEEKIDKINHDFKEFDKKKNDIIKWYYVTRLFSPSVVKNDKFNVASLKQEKELNGLKRNYEDISRKLKKFNSIKKHQQIEIEEMYNNINGLFDFANDYLKKQEEYKKSYYNNLKVSSVTICKEKTNEELEAFVKDIEQFVVVYGSIEKAKDYVYYNSGDLISELIDLLIKVVKSTKNEKTIEKYTHNFFLESDAVLTLKHSEWVNLYSKLIYVRKNITNYDEIEMIKYMKKYKQFEMRYMILLIAYEIETKRK